jgi:hypothetical protein
MDELTSLYDKKVDAMLSKMFGENSSELKLVTKLTLMNTVLTEDMKKTLLEIRERNRKELEDLEEEMTMTLDASGNIVAIPQKEEQSPRQEDMKIIYHDN